MRARSAAELITTTFLGISWVLSCFAFFNVGFKGHDAHVTIVNFITSGDLKVDWALRIDSAHCGDARSW